MEPLFWGPRQELELWAPRVPNWGAQGLNSLLPRTKGREKTREGFPLLFPTRTTLYPETHLLSEMGEGNRRGKSRRQESGSRGACAAEFGVGVPGPCGHPILPSGQWPPCPSARARSSPRGMGNGSSGFPAALPTAQAWRQPFLRSALF